MACVCFCVQMISSTHTRNKTEQIRRYTYRFFFQDHLKLHIFIYRKNKCVITIQRRWVSRTLALLWFFFFGWVWVLVINGFLYWGAWAGAYQYKWMHFPFPLDRLIYYRLARVLLCNILKYPCLVYGKLWIRKKRLVFKPSQKLRKCQNKNKSHTQISLLTPQVK